MVSICASFEFSQLIKRKTSFGSYWAIIYFCPPPPSQLLQPFPNIIPYSHTLNIKGVPLPVNSDLSFDWFIHCPWGIISSKLTIYLRNVWFADHSQILNIIVISPCQLRLWRGNTIPYISFLSQAMKFIITKPTRSNRRSFLDPYCAKNAVIKTKLPTNNPLCFRREIQSMKKKHFIVNRAPDPKNPNLHSTSMRSWRTAQSHSITYMNVREVYIDDSI